MTELPPIALIKWTGGKGRQAESIVTRFPAEIDTYHEPFLGGGSVLGRLLDSPIRVGRYSCSDSYAPLIALWNVVKDDPDRLIGEYGRMWREAGADARNFYYEIRRSFNQSRSPIEFFYLLRTCWLGIARINYRGDVTGAFDRRRNGINPEAVTGVVTAWHRKLVTADVRFSVKDYRQVASSPRDVLYLDPPYRTSFLYYGQISLGDFSGWLGSQRGGYLLSLNGFVGGEDRTLTLPSDLYDEHVQIQAGDIPFYRLSGRERTPVTDSLYIRRKESWGPQPGSTRESGSERGGRSRSRPGANSNPAPKRREVRSRSEGMSAAIRSLLNAEPDIKPAEVKRRLAPRGMAVSSTLFRVVRLNWQSTRVRPPGGAES